MNLDLSLSEDGPVTVKVYGREHASELYFAEKGRSWYCALWDLYKWLRDKLEYGDLGDAEHDVYQAVRDMLHEAMADNSVGFDDVE
jgi:hypothetical protein